MIFLKPEDYSDFKYTKINVPITLNECPSDHKSSSYLLDVNCDSFSQHNCYIGTQRIERLTIQRAEKADSLDSQIFAKWNVELEIAEVKTEDEVIEILDKLCDMFSITFIKEYGAFQHSGFEGFSYRAMDVRRRYAGEDGRFGDTVFNKYCGMVFTRNLSIVQQNIFTLPETIKDKPEKYIELETAFLTAMKCRDEVSRYILLYYMFELMYKTGEYQKMKEKYEPGNNTQGALNHNKKCPKDEKSAKRSELLCLYLQQVFGVIEYSYFDQTYKLDSEILFKIITVRNKLAHDADIAAVSSVLYGHMLPILQQVLNNIEAQV